MLIKTGITSTEISKRFTEAKYGEIPLAYYNNIFTGATTSWKQYSKSGIIPKGTRKAYIFLRAWRSYNVTNTYYAACFDDLKFTMPVYYLPFTLSPTTITVGQEVKITIDDKFNFSGITFESLDDKIASVSPQGVVKGIKAGTTTIKVIDPVFKNVENTIEVRVTGSAQPQAPQNKKPEISTHPNDQGFFAGNGANFYVSADAVPDPTYHWELSTNGSTWSKLSNSEIYRDVTTRSLYITGIPASYNGYKYRCAVTNSEGTVYSNAATLIKRDSPFSGGCGTIADPFLIKTAKELILVSDYRYLYFKLEADIDLSEYGANYNGGKGWKPLTPPYGFDGNEKTISNLFINDFVNNLGLFASSQYAPYINVKNLKLANVNIFGKSGVGGITGTLYQGTISNCSVTGTINGESNVGGIAGIAYGEAFYGNSQMGCYGIIEKCYSAATVNGTESIGGIVGTIGIIGNNSNSTYQGRVSSCYATGGVSGNKNIGGITGTIIGKSKYGNTTFVSEVCNCYATGAVSGKNDNVGGIAGFLGSDCKITNCAALNPSVKVNTSNVGRIAGMVENGSMLPNNAAFEGMLNHEGKSIWNNVGLISSDGADMSKDAINADGTLGLRFNDVTGWSYENGKLPGLLGNTVNMPNHLKTGASIIDDPTTTPSTPTPSEEKEKSLLMKIIDFILKLLNLYKETKTS